jgi:glucose-1-phosphate thymidylyltransferase
MSNKVKGVILAGGLGTRLKPLTEITNKHLLPIYDKPMIVYPLEHLVAAGITEILLVTGGNNAGDFLRLLGDGRKFGIKDLHYTYQKGEGGIAEALGLAESFADNQPIVVYLGDNLLQEPLQPFVKKYQACGRQAMVLLKSMPDPRAYGVPKFNKKQLISIQEKPTRPASPYAVIGVYFYAPSVFSIIRTLKPSRRGELEISDVNNAYIEREQMDYAILKGPWADAGESIESYFQANLAARDQRSRHDRRR